MSDLRDMSAAEFVRRLRDHVGEPDRHYVFWLGAGCSVTSGIPAAAALVQEDWLPRLQRVKGGNGDLEMWAGQAFTAYVPEDPGACYGSAMNELFPLPEERQRETERLCDGRVPGFGYGVLAALMSRDDGFFSAALTTNFDDLIADAMYVFGARRPLVIQHESLAGFVRPGRVRRPLVVKVHGDHRLNPMHTAVETEELRASVAAGIRGLLQDRGVIFVGYSGNDRGVVDTLAHLPDASLPLGVWWVSRTEPQSAIRPWLESRDAVWVRADAFDELMLLFRDEFEIEHPTARKFERMIDGYRTAYERLSARVDELPDSAPDAGALKDAARRATEAARDWWGVELAAQPFKSTDPARADAIYREGVEQIPNANLLGNYASFVTDVLQDHDRGHELHQRAIAAGPDHALNLASFALFLTDVRHEHDRAQELYERAVAAEPNGAFGLTSFASFLTHVRQDHGRAQELYERALAAEPGGGYSLSSFASFLTHVRQDHDRAQELFERAIAAEPDDSFALGGYADFLTHVREDHDRAQDLYERAIAAEPDSGYNLGNYARFLADVRHDQDRAQELYERAIVADPDNVADYASFLTDVRHDHDRAQQLYERAIAAEPDDSELLGDYALFLTDVREDHDRARDLFERAVAADPDDATNLGNFARLLFEQGDDARALALAEQVLDGRELDPDLRAEVLFYLLALGPSERRGLVLHTLAPLVKTGAGSPDWDFSRILARARGQADPRIDLLEQLAEVIAGRADLDAMQRFPEWPGS